MDGLDEMNPVPSPEEGYYGTQQPVRADYSEWRAQPLLAEARLILTRRPEPFVATFRGRGVLSIGPPPQLSEDHGTYYWGDLVKLAWTQEELSQAVHALLGGGRVDTALADLLATNFLRDSATEESISPRSPSWRMYSSKWARWIPARGSSPLVSHQANHCLSW